MKIKKSILALVMEGVTTHSISRITADERREICAIAWQIKTEHTNAICDACLIRACHTINDYYQENKKKIQIINL
jgi:hypothetical protein